MNLNPRRIALTLAAPVLAIAVAFVITSLVLAAVGDPVGTVWKVLLDEPRPRTLVNIVNSATTYYIAAATVITGGLAFILPSWHSINQLQPPTDTNT